MPKLKDKKKSIIEACMTGRGHQILEWS